MELRPNSLATFLKWLARVTSVVSIAVLVLFLGSEGGTRRPSTTELIGLFFFPVGVALGLVVAWWREALGASIAFVSLAAFYVVYGVMLSDRFPAGPWFVIFASPAALFLLSWLLRRSNVAGNEETKPV